MNADNRTEGDSPIFAARSASRKLGQSPSGGRVTVMGLGHFGGGVAAARWLARQGARVTVTDLADETTLARSLAALDDAPIAALHLGGHREEDFVDTDLVLVNPAVRPENRFVALARRAGIPITSELELFLQACSAHVIGVTGSNGKSTTAAMIAAMLRADGRNVWLGGNIGRSLLDSLSEIQDDDWVVLEVSSFQLWHLSPAAPMPEVAVVTNFSPNHLDWHGTVEHYLAAKQRILARQDERGIAVLAEELESWRPLVRGRRLPLLLEERTAQLKLPGQHNRQNAQSAATAAAGVGCCWDSIASALADFTPLAQRLEPLGTVGGRRFYNDSSATTPESTIAALRSVRGRIWLLAGGADKGIPFDTLADAVVANTCGAAFYGATAHRLLRLVHARSSQFRASAFPSVGDAFAWCWRSSAEGDCILLSPGCSSHDQFRNYAARGEEFARLVYALGNSCETKRL